MSTFQILDGVNASLAVTPNPGSAFVKYFKKVSDISLKGTTQALRSGITLADPAVTSINAGAAFQEPIDVGTSQVDLRIGGGISGSLGVFVPHGDAPKLFDPDPCEDPIAVAPDDRYVSFGICATVNPSVAGTVGDLKFGFGAGGSASFTNYRKFSVKPTPPQLTDAVRDTVAQFTIPADIEDLQALVPGQIVIVDGTGSITFSATADLLTAVNPLASASLPGPVGTVAIKAGGSVTICANVQLSGEYQIRITKVAEDLIHLAYYRKADQTLDVKATASEGLSATVGDTDLLGKLISAISADPKADTDQLKKAGLTPAEIQSIQDALKAAIARTIEVSVSAELNMAREEKAAFSYDIDISSLSAVSKNAIHSALDGDLSALTADPSTPLPGIHAAQDIFSNIRQRKYALEINLLGIVNFGWLSKLIASGKTIYDPSTGQLAITDSVTASRVSTVLANVGVADTEKLRRVLAESFLITVAYHGARRAGLAPELTTSHSYFAQNQHTSQETLRDELDVSVALGLLDRAAQEKMVASAPEFGCTLFSAATAYDSNLSQQLFLLGTQPRSQEFYEQAGLAAIACLVHDGDVDAARLLPTRDVDLWRKMKDLGQPGIGSLFPGVPDPVIGAIVADYSSIIWWAEAMQGTASRLAAMLQFLAAHPTVDDENNDFKQLRSDLANHLQSVAANTNEEFGRPWGLLAMFTASGNRAERRNVLIGRTVALAGEQPAQAGAAAFATTPSGGRTTA